MGGHEVFSAVTGGRPLSFSRRINGGSRSPELVEGNAEGAGIPLLRRRRKTRPGALEQRKSPHGSPVGGDYLMASTV